jgi:hypothetical protein
LEKLFIFEAALKYKKILCGLRQKEKKNLMAESLQLEKQKGGFCSRYSRHYFEQNLHALCVLCGRKHKKHRDTLKRVPICAKSICARCVSLVCGFLTDARNDTKGMPRMT